jgi:hypothetical protein
MRGRRRLQEKSLAIFVAGTKKLFVSFRMPAGA